jgi:hypothetical protein
MNTTHTIPTVPSRYDYEIGHFRSEATIIVEGADPLGGPGGWLVGGWDEYGEGRTEFQGVLVKGPYAFITGRAGVIDNHGGTGAIHSKAKADGLLFRVRALDTLVLAGIAFLLTVDKRGYPHLTVK